MWNFLANINSTPQTPWIPDPIHHPRVNILKLSYLIAAPGTNVDILHRSRHMYNWKHLGANISIALIHVAVHVDHISWQKTCNLIYGNF